MKPSTKRINTKFQQLAREYRNAGVKPAFTSNSQQDALTKQAFEKAEFQLAVFVIKYAHRITINDLETKEHHDR